VMSEGDRQRGVNASRILLLAISERSPALVEAITGIDEIRSRKRKAQPSVT
jgi:hypothetical protein